jgi:hypothetical protein
VHLSDIYNTVKDFLLGGKVSTETPNYESGVEVVTLKDTTPWRNKTGSYRTDLLRTMLGESKHQGLSRAQAEGVLGRSMTESGLGEADRINPLQVNEKVYGKDNVWGNIQKGVELMREAYGKYPEDHFKASQSFHRPNKKKWSPLTEEQALKSVAYKRMLEQNPQIRAFIDEVYGE